MVYKGLRKNIILIKNTKSKYFEEAYFILKDDFEKREEDYSDMISEANLIVERSLSEKEKKRRPKYSIMTFSMGAVVCALIYTLVILLLR